jgi:hypothetical protein
MASWQKRCSSQPARRTDRCDPALLLALTLLTGGCGHAGDQTPPGEAAPEPVAAAPADAAAPRPAASDALCIPAATGALRARLQGSIDAELDWGPDQAHCLGGVRPQGDGLRLVYKGSLTNVGPLLLVFGVGPLRPGESARNVPVNLTIVREGTGQFFATQGQDKCALDAVTQAPVPGDSSLYRLEGRGYCIQPARAVGGDGAVLLSRFDVIALVPVTAEGTVPAPPAREQPR